MTEKVVKPALLLYLTNQHDRHKELLAAALAWMTARAGCLFEAYFPQHSTGAHYPYPWAFHSHHGQRYGVGPLQGEGHVEQFYFLLNAFDVKLCRAEECVRFLFESRLFGTPEIARAGEEAPLDLLENVRDYLGVAPPAALIAVGEETGLRLAPYLYPEIFYRQAWALPASLLLKKNKLLAARFGPEIAGLYLSAAEEERLAAGGFKVKVIDRIKAGENYGALTGRIADRWLAKAKGIAYADPYQAEHYVPYACAEGILTLFNRDIMDYIPKGPEAMDGNLVDWAGVGQERGFAEKIAEYARHFSGKLIYGRQATDDLVTNLSRSGFVFPDFDPHRPVFPIKRKLPPRRLVGSQQALFACQRNRAEIKAAILDAGKIPVVFLTYSADLRHVAGLRRFLEAVALRRIPWGLTVNPLWFSHHPEWLQELFIPLEQGGVFPLVEPLLGGGGWGLSCNAQGYFEDEALAALLKSALASIASYVGQENLPRGAYPFQDANPAYTEKAEPLFQPYLTAGLKFSFTHRNFGAAPQVVFRQGDFVALNQPITFFPEPFFFDPVQEIKRWEKELAEKGRGWITAAFDFPLWFQSPYILDMGPRLLAVMDYVKRGGESGRLTVVPPGELAEYARLTADGKA